MSDNPTDMTATTLTEAARTGAMAVTEIVEAHIRRIEAVNDRINAVIWPLFDDALAQAESADQARAQGKPLGPLFGVPMTIKDQFNIKGTPTSCGLAHRAKTLVGTEGSLVARLREGGAIFLGKTNLPQLLVSHQCDHALYGPGRNPWDLERTPGGSSGGEAAIIAAYGSPLGLGADMGGSIRIPAHCCGICGLKPTNGRFPNDDSPLEMGYFDTLYGFEGVVVQPGPMARTVDDLKLMMDILLSEPFQSRDVVPPTPWSIGPVSRPENIRIGVYDDNEFFTASPALRRVVREAADALSNAGLSVKIFNPPNIPKGIELYFSLLTTDGGAWIQHALQREAPIYDMKAVAQAAGFPNALRKPFSLLLRALGQHHSARLIRLPGRSDASRYWRLTAERSRYRGRFIEAMSTQGVDILICPPFGLPAPRVDGNRSGENTLACSHAAIFNFVGMPAGVVAASRVRADEESDRRPSRDRAETAARAVERGSAGLPVGVQIVGRHWREDQVLAVMKVLEDHFRTQPGYPTRPPLS